MKRGDSAMKSPDAAAPERLHLMDGRQVVCRPIAPNDAEALRRAILAADPETIRLRFLGGRPPMSQKQLHTLVDVDHLRREALVACTDEGRLVGIARYAVIDDGVADLAVAVDHDWRCVGLATALLQRLLIEAYANGIRLIHADYYGTNRNVHELIAELGGATQTRMTDGVVEADIELDPAHLRAGDGA
jgi:acetyltransferase